MAGGLLIALGFEFWFFLWEYLDKEISLAKMLFLEIIVFLAFVWNINVLFGDASSRFALQTIVIAPVIYGIINGIGKLLDLRISKLSRDTEVANLTYTVQQQPDNVNAFVSLGDIYFKERDYDTAISCYRQATQVMNFPWINEKQRGELSRDIKKGLFWIVVGPLIIVIPLVFIMWLIMIMPKYLSVIFVLFLLYLGFRLFQRFMDN